MRLHLLMVGQKSAWLYAATRSQKPDKPGLLLSMKQE
jgi:hypothetical protein